MTPDTEPALDLDFDALFASMGEPLAEVKANPRPAAAITPAPVPAPPAKPGVTAPRPVKAAPHDNINRLLNE